MLEVIERYQYHCDVIKCSSQQRVFEDVLDTEATLLVDVLSITLGIVVVDAVPHTLDSVLVIELVKDAIASQDDEVVLFHYLERLDLRCGNHHIGIASKLCYLCFSITKCSRD